MGSCADRDLILTTRQGVLFCRFRQVSLPCEPLLVSYAESGSLPETTRLRKERKAMSPRRHDTRKQPTEKETWIISKTEEGSRIYSPKYPSFVFMVSGLPDEPSCTCLEFKHREDDSDWQCKHILAVLSRMV